MPDSGSSRTSNSSTTEPSFFASIFARVRRRRGSAALLFTAALLLEFLVGPIPTAGAVDDDGLFELDGNALNAIATPGDDWNSLAGAFVSTGVIAEPAALDSTYFTQGGSKDTNDVSMWRYGGSSVPSKDEITNAYAAVYNNGGATRIYFGLDRFAVNGDANVGFWFFRNAVTLGSGGVFSGVHANGDIFIVSAFTNGGAVSSIDVYEWQSGALVGPVSSGAQCAPGGPSDDACAIVNPAPQLAPWAYVPKAGAAGTFPISAFFEGGINISALLPGVQCFSSFLAETRSSQTPNAQLKDFALGNFDTCRVSIGIDPQDALNPVATNHVLTVNVSKDTGSGYGPAAGVLVSTSIVSGPGSYVGSSSCTTDALGECTVTITSAVVGTTVVTASATVVIGGASYPVSTDAIAPNSGPASKTWFLPRLGTSTTTTPTPDPIVLGQSVRDGADVEDENGDPVIVGNLTFYLCAEGVFPCLAGDQIGSPVDLNASGHADSDPVTPDATGTYCFRGEYSGAITPTEEFSPSTDAGPNECFEVVPANSSTSTHPSDVQFILGGSASDLASVAGLGPGFPAPTGTVTFYLCAIDVVPCASGGVQLGDPVALDGSGLAESESVTPPGTGTYCFRAVYAGDANYSASTDNGSEECFEVDPAGSTTVTAPSAASIGLGGSESDHATVSGLGAGFPVPTGSVTFYVCAKDVLPCASGGTQLGSPVLLDSLGEASSIGFTPTAAGTYCFRGEYGGDANYSASKDNSSAECFDVARHASQTVTHPSDSSIGLGQSVHDDAVVSGGLGGSFPAPSGTVTFYVCAVSVVPCASGGTLLDAPVVLVAGAASSIEYQPAGAGTYCFRGEYSGDDNYAPSNDSSVQECFSVTVSFTTRTQGFWSTHLSYTASVWAGIPAGQRVLCTKNLGDGSNDIPELMGGFWSGISTKSNDHKRNPVDQARMTMLQQLLAAMLNVGAFGSDDGGNIAAAKAALCGNNRALILSLAAALDAFNQSGDSTPLGFNAGPADPSSAQAIADKPFWDSLP